MYLWVSLKWCNMNVEINNLNAWLIWKWDSSANRTRLQRFNDHRIRACAHVRRTHHQASIKSRLLSVGRGQRSLSLYILRLWRSNVSSTLWEVSDLKRSWSCLEWMQLFWSGAFPDWIYQSYAPCGFVEFVALLCSTNVRLSRWPFTASSFRDCWTMQARIQDCLWSHYTRHEVPRRE